MRVDLKTLAEYLQAGNPNDCLTITELALEVNPNDCLMIAYRGIAQGLLGNTQQEIIDLRTAADQAEASGQNAIAAFAFHYLGNAYGRLGQSHNSWKALEHAANLGSQDVGLFTGLCQTAIRLGDVVLARKWGEKALLTKDLSVTCNKVEEVSRQRPHPFNPNARSRNIVSYSLFGKDQFYQECAVVTARMLPYIYPEFTGRFYCSSTIPKSVLDALKAAGSQVVNDVYKESHLYSGLMWRFLPFDDPNVDIVLVRDVDSPFTLRERAGVDLWLERDQPFHVMRDHIQHTAPILAGLWGGFTKLLPPLFPSIFHYQQKDTSRYADQNYLRYFVWPRIRLATLAIDSIYTLRETMDFPQAFPKCQTLHVGCNWQRKMIKE